MIKIPLPENLVEHVDSFASIAGCTTPEQIEKWIKIAMVAEEHPDLSISFVKEIVELSQ